MKVFDILHKAVILDLSSNYILFFIFVVCVCFKNVHVWMDDSPAADEICPRVQSNMTLAEYADKASSV